MEGGKGRSLLSRHGAPPNKVSVEGLLALLFNVVIYLRPTWGDGAGRCRR